MKTILISGNDTNIGKTWICRALANYFALQNQNVQVVKVVETGISHNQKGDAATAAEHVLSKAYTLYSFPEPLAPVSASQKAGRQLNLENIITEINKLPKADWRLLETAGGLAVPLDETGFDSVNLALDLPVDYLVLVVQNRLGAIHQTRVLTAYAPYSKITTGIWFNDSTPVDEIVTQSNYSELKNIGVPIWGHQRYEARELQFFDSFAKQVL